MSSYNIMKNNVLEQFKNNFGNPQLYVKSPGRANIIGEHTDYNHGLVLPFAINQCIHFYLGSNKLELLRAYAIDLDEFYEIEMHEVEFQKNGWSRYLVNSLVACGFDKSQGIDVVFGGDLPQGGGVSSSSALTCGFLAGINSLFKLEYSTDYLIKLASQAENGIGLNGGIMDQSAIFKGKSGYALLIDFADFSVSEVEMPSTTYSFYLFNSGQKHNLVDTEYNRRRATCDRALKTIQSKKQGVAALRNITREDIDVYLENEVAKRRCIHVLEENKRVIMATQILKDKSYKKLGALLLESHYSLSQNYEVSTSEIDYLVDRSQQISNMLGSRIMGGGFGGCTINFTKGKLNESEVKQLIEDYNNETGYDLKIDEISASDGIEVIKL